MPNTHVFETKMSDRMQVTRYSVPVYAAQASFEERAKLVDGQSVTRPSVSRFFDQDYTRGVDMVIPDRTETNETLTVTTAKSVPFAIDDLDALQSNFKLMNEYSGRAMRALNKSIDADYLSEVVSATSSVDASDFGGAAGAGITVDATNVLKIFPAANRKLENLDVMIQGGVDPRAEGGNMKPGGKAGFANMTPYFKEQLSYSLSGRETSDGDMIGKNGYSSHYFGFDTFVTTNGYWTGTLTVATQPTDGDTVTVNGVVFTFKTTLGVTAGNVLIGASADTAATNLAALVNAPSVTTVQGVALSAANQNLMRRISATAVNASDVVNFIAKGYPYIVVSETLTAAADIWSLRISNNMFGQKGAVDMVVQIKPTVKVSDIPLQIGNYVKPHTLYGKKTFAEGASALVNVKIDSSSWV